MQSINSQLERQLREGEGDLQQKSNDLRRIRGENERADRVIKELARKSEMNQAEI